MSKSGSERISPNFGSKHIFCHDLPHVFLGETLYFPWFSVISQQPTVETFSNLANRLITYRSIYWCCRLAFKKSPLSPWANTFLVPTGPGNPIFPPISQQPTVENFSTHENRLIRYQSIYCCCILAFKMWPQCRIHHLEETHPPYPRAEMPCFPQYLNNWT